MLANRIEALVYLAAHELRHLWQAARLTDRRITRCVSTGGSAVDRLLPGFLIFLCVGCGANNQYECIERTQKDVPNFQASGTHTEVDYVLLHDGHKFYAACDTTTLDKLDPTATCAFRVLRNYECVQPTDNKPNKALSDLRCKDDEGRPVYLYVSKKE